MHICLHSEMTSYPGSRTIHQILWLKFFFDSRLQYESLEGLMDFLAFLVQRFWQNKQKLIREIQWNYSAMSSMIWGLQALTWAPETLGSRSRPLQVHIPALNTTKLWVTILAHCPGDDVTIEQPKKSKTYPFSNDTHRKPWTQISKVFLFCANYKTSWVFRGFE